MDVFSLGWDRSCLSECLPVYLPVCLSLSLPAALPLYLPASMHPYLSVSAVSLIMPA